MEVSQIMSLVECLEHSSFDFLQVDAGNFKVTISKRDLAERAMMSVEAPQSNEPPARTVGGSVDEVTAPVATLSTTVPDEKDKDSSVAIVAPMMGRYYASPEPGAPPFVKVGDVVDLETTVGLIEIMKVFTAVAAGVCGVVTEMCVQDTEFVEYAQILYRVRPS